MTFNYNASTNVCWCGGPKSTTTKTETMKYDANGNLIEKTETSTTESRPCTCNGVYSNPYTRPTYTQFSSSSSGTDESYVPKHADIEPTLF